MNRYFIKLLCTALVILLCAGCSAKDDHSSVSDTYTGTSDTTTASAENSDQSAQSSASDNQESTNLQSTDDGFNQDITQDITQDTSVSAEEGDLTYDTLIGYDYDVVSDAEQFDYNNIDIVVGDNLYMTQINDWFMNFTDYEGKTVEIEGYFISFDPYTFVGRYGPTCPYCTGGYVDFEFHGLESMLSGLIANQSWIRVYGILRQGEDSTGMFYYIEAVKVETLDTVGIDTITN